MKSSLTAKIVILLCIISIIIGAFNVNKDNPYGVKEINSSYKDVITTGNKIAVMELEGTIASSYESGFFAKEANAASLLKSLKSAALDPNIKGIIIRINSPGGTVAMSQNIYNQIIKIRKDKPVIAVFDDVAASGGYYIASAADRIISQEGTLTGSIGVIFSFMDYHNLLTDKLNINPVVIKSGKYKDIGSGMRQMTAEEKNLMQNIVNDSYSQFIEAITNGRINRTDKYSAQKTDLTSETLKSNADGRVFTGRQAQKLGFVDTIGDIDTATQMIETMAQEKFSNSLKAKLVNYNKKTTFSEYFSSFTEYGAKQQFDLKNILPDSMILNKRPLYLWE